MKRIQLPLMFFQVSGNPLYFQETVNLDPYHPCDSLSGEVDHKDPFLGQTDYNTNIIGVEDYQGREKTHFSPSQREALRANSWPDMPRLCS